MLNVKCLMLIFKTNIMTREEFAERWQQHYPTMDLQAEVSFYYDIYQRICSVAKDGSKKINEVFKWTVEDSTDLNYGLRVLEGWMKQLKSYDWEIFKGKGAFDLDKAIKDVENLLKK